MTVDRSRVEAPPLVTSLVGIVIAVVSAVFGISAHGLAAGSGAVMPGPGQLLMVLGASAGVGALTASVARRRPPVVPSAVGLLAGQLLVHLTLVSGHAHNGAGHAHIAGHAVDAVAVRAAMDGAATGGGLLGVHAESLLTPGMLGAHLGAITVTVAVVAILAVTLSWVAARVLPLLASVHLVVVGTRSPRGRVPVPDVRYLLARGGTRAPPVGV